MNIALVVLDTLRKDIFDEHFEWLPGARFERAFSTSNWTVPAHASLFTGRYPGELGIHSQHTTFDCPETMLTERLADDGYTTRGFSCNVQVSWPSQFNRGFEEFDAPSHLQGLSENIFDWETFIGEHHNQGPARYLYALKKCVTSDCDTLPSLRRGLDIKLRDIGLSQGGHDAGAHEALEHLRETRFGDDEFVFINLMESHAPYAPPKEYRTTDAPVEELTAYNALLASIKGTAGDVGDDLQRQAYNDSVKYLSDIYQKIFDELRPDFDLVITVGDHGECFGEHGIYQHSLGIAPELTHVPLVLSSTDSNTRRTETVSLLDVHTTVLDAAGCATEENSRSLLDDLESRPVFTEYHGVTNPNRANLETAGYDPEPYDQRLVGVGTKNGYGHETLDGFEKTGNDDFYTLIQEHCESSTWRDLTDNAEVSESVRQRLTDLGYA